MARTNIYTYDDFLKAMEQSGLGGQFSDADMNLARQNPDAGMSLLSYKTDYANAATDEARALANQGAETVRASYGGYTGGGDGGSFKMEPMSPRQFTYGDAPEFEDRWGDRIDRALEASQGRQPYSYAGAAPEYESRYDPDIQRTITDILGRGEFSYDPKTDPVYSAYQKQYAREGQRATANAMGEASAMTGGMPSSWAMTAASQAGDYYASQMADKIPELYRDAYNRYLQEYQMKLSDLDALRGLESDDYTKYRDRLSQYNTDRSFDYARWLDEQELGQRDIENLRALRADDLDLYKTNLGQYNTNRTFDYGQWLDEIENQRTRREDERTWAATAADAGDYSLMEALGVNMDRKRENDAFARAAQLAEVGDYSGFEALGVDVSDARTRQQLERAAELAKVGDYSGYRALGIDTSAAERAAALDQAAALAEVGDWSGYEALGVDVSDARTRQQLERAYKQAQIDSTYANMDTEEDRALERAYRQAQIESVYAGMDTEEDRALEREYRRAQIEKAQSGGTGDTGMTENQRVSRLLEAAKMAYQAGDMETYSALMKEAGYGTDEETVQQTADAKEAKKTAKADKVTNQAQLMSKFAVIRKDFLAGDPDLDTREKVLAVIEEIPGYTKKQFGAMTESFLRELFPEEKAAAGTGGTKTTVSRNPLASGSTIGMN